MMKGGRARVELSITGAPRGLLSTKKNQQIATKNSKWTKSRRAPEILALTRLSQLLTPDLMLLHPAAWAVLIVGAVIVVWFTMQDDDEG